MRNFFVKMVRGITIIYMYVVVVFAYELIVVETTPVSASDRQVIYPCGEIVGLYVECEGIFVVDTCEIESNAGELINPSKGILQTGDYIISVNGEEVSKKEELVDVLSKSNGETVQIVLDRNEKLLEVSVVPVLTKSGEYKLGVWIKDDLAGVGTITYVTEGGSFGALGHGMSDGETSELVDIAGGDVYISNVVDIEKGKKGDPGQVRGILYYGLSNHLGKIDENTSIGVYGQIDNDNMTDFITKKTAYEIAYKQEAKVGVAQIISDISGEEKYYDIEVTYVDYLSLNASKGLHIKVTDPDLLALTGGIVQGMSGSPIIQDGRIIGAVTHVLINDPTSGYGIFIEEMLE